MEDNKDRVKKGSFRLWLSLSVIWWLVSLIVIIVFYQNGELSRSQHFILPIGIAVFPPFALYLFSKACYWIYEGFKEDK